MSSLSFALKRTCSSWLFMLYLLFIFAAVLAASFYGSFAGLPPAGIYNEGSGSISQKAVSLLEQRGFVEYGSAEEMKLALQEGIIDCAAILPADFDKRLQEGDTKELIGFISAPSSFAPMIYQSHLTSVLYSEYVPYITASSLAEYGIPQAEVLQAYEAMLADGYAFSFELLSADGMPPVNVKSHNLVTAAAAILLFIAICIFSVPLLGEAFSPIALRIGIGKTLLHIILPNLALRALFAASAAALALLAAGLLQADAFYFGIAAAVFVYALLLMAAALLFGALMPRASYQNVFLTLLVLLSLAICPIFVDIALLSPILKALRFCLPCYWLWLLPEHMLLMSLLALLVLPIAFLLLFYRCRAKHRFKLTAN